MIKCKDFVEHLHKYNINFYIGVPDSLLNNLSKYFLKTLNNKEHIIAANEGNALAIAVGNYLATNSIPVVYMQNSGIGNIVNPVVSLIDSKVYNIPILFLIGWRGKPDIYDEPQHIQQGKITKSLLDLIDIKNSVMPENIKDAKIVINEAINYMLKTNKPYALIIQKDTFEEEIYYIADDNKLEITREKAIEIIISNLNDDDIIVSTTGKISREVFEIRENLNQSHKNDFLVVGSMGFASSIAAGIANANSYHNIYCLDGDGSAIMHMGSMSIIGQMKLKNLRHIILNNGCHESVGISPTVGFEINFCSIAKSCGYDYIYYTDNKTQLNNIFFSIKELPSSTFLEVRINQISRKNLGRPSNSLINSKELFMKNFF